MMESLLSSNVLLYRSLKKEKVEVLPTDLILDRISIRKTLWVGYSCEEGTPTGGGNCTVIML